MYGFKGELTLTNAIIQVSGESRPIIAFTQGHSEISQQNTILAATLEEAGFSLINVDLSEEDIPDETRILFINSPEYDFAGYADEKAGGVNEIDKLADFMVDFNHIMVTVDPEKPELPELAQFLSEWGLGWQVNTQIVDTKGSSTGLNSKATRLIAEFAGEDGTAAYQVHKTLSEMASPPRILFNNATPIVISEPTNNSTAEVAFTSKDTAVSYKNSLEVDRGKIPLMGVSSKSRYEGKAGEQVLTYSTIVLIGSTDFGGDDYVNGIYGNNEVFYSLARIMGSKRVPNGLEFKKLFDQTLTIEQSTAETLTIALSAIGPLFVAIIGFIVFLKRRHL